MKTLPQNSSGEWDLSWKFAGGSLSESTSGTSEESGKGLKSADTIKIEGGTMQIDSADDSLHSNNAVYISGGTIKAESGDDGIHADTLLIISEGNIEISKSYEGIESSQIEISGGTISIVASDDGINAAGGAGFIVDRRKAGSGNVFFVKRSNYNIGRIHICKCIRRRN